jgi:hypothetical protein
VDMRLTIRLGFKLDGIVGYLWTAQSLGLTGDRETYEY